MRILLTGGLSTIAIVRIQVTDVNDNRPIFQPRRYNVTLRGESAVHGPILKLVASDRDVGLFGQVAYRISSGNEAGVFRIDRNTGELHVARPSLLSRSPFYQLNVTATDAAGLKSAVDAEVKITVSSAGHRIATCEKPRYTVTVKESISQNTVVGGVKDATSSSSTTGKSIRGVLYICGNLLLHAPSIALLATYSCSRNHVRRVPRILWRCISR